MPNPQSPIPNGNPLIQVLHTAVKGRARYKVSGLYYSESLKIYLESKLLEEKIITQVRANPTTGNVLVLFHPEINPNAIAWLLQEIVVNYTKLIRKLPVKTANTNAAPTKVNNLPVQKQLNKAGNKLVLLSGAVSTFILCATLLRRSGLDEVILLTIQKLHTPLLDRIMVGITFLGEPLVLLLVCLGLATRSAYNQRPWEATTLGLAAVGAIGLNIFLKKLFSRARPALWDHLVNVRHYSFPSGHAMASMVIYGFIGYILAKQFPQHRRLIFVGTAVLILAIGLTRLYLGVHWPTDVIAGYAVGLVWLTACIQRMEIGEKFSLVDYGDLPTETLLTAN
ncbi:MULTISPECIES: phosphatase PAP2 family protein [Fischerella]|uniref:PAP2 family protein n=1 Tax=Fischerella muscicola CCMEE 5323 TaxID=2019572 RepID=A0A2N6K2S3_FISMU|nr:MULTISPECIES: phosphatase PAP2 family protein [Fischerella]MBD2434903.1 phosphatase PAP2 family protein [Fischerella sp. FACHB-380]PLZ89530.1 PAP2 family protein [Fischerella muscicola CCMEE 5323]